MEPIFKRVHIDDARKAYKTYEDNGKPVEGKAFEVLMVQHAINTVNNKFENKGIIEMNKSEFKAYQVIFSL
jgi:hypothetical protein